MQFSTPLLPPQFIQLETDFVHAQIVTSNEPRQARVQALFLEPHILKYRFHCVWHQLRAQRLFTLGYHVHIDHFHIEILYGSC